MHRLPPILSLLTLLALPACSTPASTSAGPGAATDNTCRPNCLTRSCGPDGCGGTCGTCSCASSCDNGLCASKAAGRWTGSYVCRQGRTSLELEVSGSGEDLEAVFTFSAHRTNPGVPTGSFRMTGELDCQGNLSLQPERWIERPEGYVAVGLAGKFESDGEGRDDDRLRGRIVGAGCSEFEVRRE